MHQKCYQKWKEDLQTYMQKEGFSMEGLEGFVEEKDSLLSLAI